VRALGIADEATTDLAAAVKGADCVIFCVPVGANGAVAAVIGAHLKPGAIVSDVGSVKGAVVRDVGPHLPEGVHFVPAIRWPAPNIPVRTPDLPRCSKTAGRS
jgi:cyclohexadieny/prephenate dehydrogenase